METQTNREVGARITAGEVGGNNEIVDQAITASAGQPSLRDNARAKATEAMVNALNGTNQEN